MDFVVGLPKTTNGYDAIWVIVDRLNKSAHFLPIKITYSLEQLVDLYVKELYDCIEFRYRSYRTEIAVSHQHFGEAYKEQWVLN